MILGRSAQVHHARNDQDGHKKYGEQAAIDAMPAIRPTVAQAYAERSRPRNVSPLKSVLRVADTASALTCSALTCGGD